MAWYCRSERPAAAVTGFLQGGAPVEERFAPDPWLVCAAHLGFYCMDTAEISLPAYPAQEGTDGDIPAGLRVAHLERDDTPEIFGMQGSAGYPAAIVAAGSEPAQNIRPALLDPGIDIRRCWRDRGTEDPAADTALLTGFVFRFRHDHAASLPSSSGIRTKVGIGSVLPIVPAAGCMRIG